MSRKPWTCGQKVALQTGQPNTTFPEMSQDFRKRLRTQKFMACPPSSSPAATSPADDDALTADSGIGQLRVNISGMSP